MPDADTHFQIASTLLDQARLDSGKLELYLSAADHFLVASTMTEEMAASASDFSLHELLGLSSYFAHEAWHSRAMYWYEHHDIPKAKHNLAKAKQFSNRSVKSFKRALKFETDSDSHERVIRKLAREMLCHKIDEQWTLVFDARESFDSQEWQKCLELYGQVLSGLQLLFSECRKVADDQIAAAIESSYYVVLLNICQVTIGVEQSRAEALPGMLHLSSEQAIVIIRNWLDAYRFAMNAVTAHPGVQRFYSGLVHIRLQLEKIANDFPWRFLIDHFGGEGDLVGLLRAIDPKQLKQVLASTGKASEVECSCRVLFLASNPSDPSIGRLKIDREAGELLYALRHGGQEPDVDISFRWAAKPTDIQQCVLSYRPKIVHFSGHGTTDGEIVMEDFCGRPFVVSASGLSKLFACFDGEVKVVLLNACFSAKQAKGIAEYVDCVIGMDESIGDMAARRFAVSFYRAVSYGKSVGCAFDLACNELMLSTVEREDLPRLISRSGVDPKSVFVVDGTQEISEAS